MIAPLRVALDVRPLALESVSGIGFYVAQLLEEIPRDRVSFVAISDRPVPAGRLPPRIPIHVEGPPGRRIRWESGVLPRLLHSIAPPPDLYHATWNHGIPPGLPFPSLLTLHDLIPWQLPREVPWPRPAWLHRALYRGAVRGSARRAAVIVTVSRASADEIARRIPEAAARIEVVHHGVPRWFGAADPAKVAAFRAEYGAPYWLYVGGFDPRKGIFTLLAATALAFPAGTNPRLVLAGGSNEHARACEAMAAGLRVKAAFPGYVADADLASLYAGASLFLYPSLYEGFGIPPLLALASGVPSIVSNGGALPEVVGEDATIVPAGNVPALAGALSSFDHNPAAALARVPAGRERAARFSLEAFASRTLRAYDRALGRREGSA